MGLIAGIPAGTITDGAAKQRRKPRKNRQRLERNQFGCVDVGGVCRDASHCCSGICEGKKRKRRCRPHDAGGCEVEAQPAICTGVFGACTTSAGLPGRCATTTGKAGYCHDDILCFACKTDLDCPAMTNAGPGAACVRCADCPETGGLACAVFDGSLG